MMEWYWVYLIIGVCLYALCFATGKVEADGALNNIAALLYFSLLWPLPLIRISNLILSGEGVGRKVFFPIKQMVNHAQCVESQ